MKSERLYLFTDNDLWVGRRLICYRVIKHAPYWDSHFVGSSYHISKNVSEPSSRKFHIESEGWGRRLVNHHDLNTEGAHFFPYDLLSDKEKFLYELIGDVPGSLR